MKDSKFRYYLCYYSHLCFFYSFWGYFLYKLFCIFLAWK